MDGRAHPNMSARAQTHTHTHKDERAPVRVHTHTWTASPWFSKGDRVMRELIEPASC